MEPQDENLSILTYDPNVDINILSYLDDDILLNMCSTNSYVNSLCNEEKLWILKLNRKYGPYRFDKYPYKSYRDIYMDLTVARMILFSTTYGEIKITTAFNAEDFDDIKDKIDRYSRKLINIKTSRKIEKELKEKGYTSSEISDLPKKWRSLYYDIYLFSRIYYNSYLLIDNNPDDGPYVYSVPILTGKRKDFVEQLESIAISYIQGADTKIDSSLLLVDWKGNIVWNISDVDISESLPMCEDCERNLGGYDIQYYKKCYICENPHKYLKTVASPMTVFVYDSSNSKIIANDSDRIHSKESKNLEELKEYYM